MLGLLLISLGLTGVTVLVHGVGILFIIQRMLRIWQRKRSSSATFLTAEILIIRLVCFLLLLHLAEAAVWGAFYSLSGMLATFETALYFSITSFATLGYGDVVLSGPWRMLGPIESLVGVLMMGWSTGLIVAVILRAYAYRFNYDPPQK